MTPTPLTAQRHAVPSERSATTRWWVLSLPVVVLTFDQALKQLMIQWLGPDAPWHRWELAGRLVAFEYVENRGAAFGILPGRTTLLTLVALAMTIAATVLMMHEARRHPVGAAGIGLVVGGALGNVVDRIRLGYVVDYIAVGVWPKFNLADTAITIGIALLLWSGIREEAAERQEGRGDVTPRGDQQRGSASS